MTNLLSNPLLSTRPLTPAPQPVIQVDKLWTQFGKTVVLQDLDLTIEQGEIVGVIGGSGSGKTTLLRQILGLNRPTRGTVSVLGLDISKASVDQMAALQNRWGMLFQMGALFSALTVLDNVAMPLRELRALPESLILDAALLKLQLAGIGPEHALKMPSDLSGGMIKRVALARALALEPELLFLDEPTAGLDPASSAAFVKLILSLHKDMRLTVVMITHDLESLLAMSTKIAVLADKHVLAYDTPEQVMKIKHPFIENFFLSAHCEQDTVG
ncbi:ATP-binding cassette domain-containing protein [Glaciimonas sp. Gout2]|uniref:ABC transporter ATP-binding protein n=1 Tax=unclassified Glaciimonas TaxID=2644401 RepID=UPI002B222AC8|nr:MULTISPECIES: ATP-binding cassette domain-containing protein [unclassified Glaciimonas]MEB0010832.1 ATP-binding cassette domain-containing protein [Glaciimonas sp. Cout2]MEB0081613.1 ATP-binding cassette domain-containing protein [Glaciimonas sp. Gout2]